jgi:hypothetical protein
MVGAPAENARMKWFSRRRLGLAGLLAATFGVPEQCLAHEFWIEPAASILKDGERLTADLKVGLDFRGASFPYLQDRFVRFSLLNRSQRYAVVGEDGDIPAINLPHGAPGLDVIAYHSTPDRLTYDDWKIFVAYAEDEGLTDLLRRHAARGLPQRGFVELYTRCAKSLVQVGPVTNDDKDLATGMPFELVAQANPYAEAADTLVVKLYWQGVPQSGKQVSLFVDDGHVSKRKFTTDRDGNISVPLAGGGRFMLNAVEMQETEKDGASWQSHWASLTFQLPVKPTINAK